MRTCFGRCDEGRVMVARMSEARRCLPSTEGRDAGTTFFVATGRATATTTAAAQLSAAATALRRTSRGLEAIITCGTKRRETGPKGQDNVRSHGARSSRNRASQIVRRNGSSLRTVRWTVKNLTAARVEPNSASVAVTELRKMAHRQA